MPRPASIDVLYHVTPQHPRGVTGEFDLTEAQISEVLGCAPGTVKSQASAALKALRRALAASGVGEVLGGL